jgi:hypothetical protein
MDYYPEALKIVPALYDSNKSNNMQPLRDLFSDKTLSEFSKELKEKEVITELIVCYGVIKNPEEIISYLIWDYKIEKIALETFNPQLDIIKRIKEMIHQRKVEEMHSDLQDELDTKSNQNNKKPKV